jgi:hypothetical protein
MIARNWLKPRRIMTAALFVVVLGLALLLVHYARWDVIAKYPIDGSVNSCHSEGFICQTMVLDVTPDGTQNVYHLTLPAEGGEVAELARATGPGSHVRVYYERRAIWVPWEGSTRRAVGIDWLAPGTPAVIGDGGAEAARSESIAREPTR